MQQELLPQPPWPSADQSTVASELTDSNCTMLSYFLPLGMSVAKSLFPGERLCNSAVKQKK